MVIMLLLAFVYGAGVGLGWALCALRGTTGWPNLLIVLILGGYVVVGGTAHIIIDSWLANARREQAAVCGQAVELQTIN